MAETHSSTILTYFSVGGDINIPLDADPKSIEGIIFGLQNGWFARWEGKGFYHTPRTGGAGHYSEIINYTTWDGRNWQARWVEDGNEGYFLHTRAGNSHKDRVLNYLDWEGNLWSATRKNETEFQHVFFADAPRRRSFLDDIAGWVVDHWKEIAVKIIEYVLKKDPPPNTGALSKGDCSELKWGSTVSKDYK